MRLSARDTYWCQYVYQFAHELCHVMINFDRHRAHKHRWFSEALCELASLVRLAPPGGGVAEDPPDGVAEAAAFAPNFATYATRVAERYSRPGDLPRWLADHLPGLEADPYGRDGNGVLAVDPAATVLENPSLWRDCGPLNCWDPYANATFRDYLDAWARHPRPRGARRRGCRRSSAHRSIPRAPTPDRPFRRLPTRRGVRGSRSLPARWRRRG